jgi:hypothetical protein
MPRLTGAAAAGGDGQSQLLLPLPEYYSVDDDIFIDFD